VRKRGGWFEKRNGVQVAVSTAWFAKQRRIRRRRNKAARASRKANRA
jgi:hypothetical protein